MSLGNREDWRSEEAKSGDLPGPCNYYPTRDGMVDSRPASFFVEKAVLFLKWQYVSQRDFAEDSNFEGNAGTLSMEDGVREHHSPPHCRISEKDVSPSDENVMP